MATNKKVVKTATKKAPPKKVASKSAAAKPVLKKAAAKTTSTAKKVKETGKTNGKVIASAVKPKVQNKTSKPIQAASKKQASKVKAVAKAPVKKATSKTVAKPLPKVNTKAAAKTPVPVKKVVALTPTKKPVVLKKPDTSKMAKETKTTKKEKVVQPKKEAPKKITKVVPKNIKDIKVIPAKPVTLPKIKTKTSRPFQPDFKSVLEHHVQNYGESIVRYTDAELMEFRELISRKLESARKEWSYLQGLISRKDDTGGDESENRYMTMEDGSLSMEREQLGQMASRQVNFIDHLEKAIMRIENKTYGICRVTGKLIDKARLRAVPHATLCIEAKMNNSK